MRRILVLFVALLSSTVATASTTYSKTLPAGAKDRIVISNIAGSVRIRAWDRPEVDVQGRLEPGVERVDVVRRGSSVDIRVVVEESWFFHRDGSAQLDIYVPAGSELEVSTVSASISVDRVLGRMLLKSVSGGIRSDGQGRELEARSVSGGIDVTGSGQPGYMRLSSVSGSVRAGRVAGEIEANSTSGRMRISADLVDRAQLHSVSGSVSFSGRLSKTGALEAETVSGGIDIVAAGDAGYTYAVSTFSGSIRSCFGDGNLRKRSHGSGSELTGSRDQGSARMRLRALSGSVTVCDR